MRAGALVEIHGGGTGTDARVVIGLDVGADRTAMHDDSEFPVPMTRWRITAGPRLALQFPDYPHTEVFARFGVGVDRIHMDNTEVLEALCGDPTIQSAAFDGAIGVGVTGHHVLLGVQLGAAISDHGGDRPTCKPVNGQPVYLDVLDTHNVDLNAQLFVGVRL